MRWLAPSRYPSDRGACDPVLDEARQCHSNNPTRVIGAASPLTRSHARFRRCRSSATSAARVCKRRSCGFAATSPAAIARETRRLLQRDGTHQLTRHRQPTAAGEAVRGFGQSGTPDVRESLLSNRAAQTDARYRTVRRNQALGSAQSSPMRLTDPPRTSTGPGLRRARQPQPLPLTTRRNERGQQPSRLTIPPPPCDAVRNAPSCLGGFYPRLVSDDVIGLRRQFPLRAGRSLQAVGCPRTCRDLV
jgi:hypothetical protein